MIRITLLFYVLFTVMNVSYAMVTEQPLNGQAQQFNVQNNLPQNLINPVEIDLAHPILNVQAQNNDVQINLGPANTLNLYAVPNRLNYDEGECNTFWFLNLINELLPILLPLPAGLVMIIINFMLRGSVNLKVFYVCITLNLVLFAHHMILPEETGEFGGEDSSLSLNPTIYPNPIKAYMILALELLNQLRFCRWERLRTSVHPKPPIFKNMNYGFKLLATFNSAVPIVIPTLPLNIAIPLGLASMVQSIDQELILLLGTINGIILANSSYPNMSDFINWVNIGYFALAIIGKEVFDMLWKMRILKN